MPIDLGTIKAIDVHVHAEVSCHDPEDPVMGQFFDAASAYSSATSNPHWPSALASQTFYRAGSQLVSDAPIQLYGLNGRLLRQSQLSGSTSNLSLEGMNQGVFLAKSGAQVIKVNVQ